MREEYEPVREQPVVEQESRPTEGPPSPAHALLWGLRWTGNEEQLTQAVAEAARADRRFATGFVGLLLDTAARDAHAKNVARLLRGGVPDRLECRAEAHLQDTADVALGRVDLRFDGEDFTLFVENKLHSGYGDEQVDRYLRALRRLPPDNRAALIAVTRTVPTYGEPELETDSRWLGSVRWARMLGGLRKLRFADSQLGRQWRFLVDTLHEQGDLGMTRVDADLIRAWARYRDGRSHLEDLVDQVWPRALDIVRREMKSKYRQRDKAEELVDLYRRGKRRGIVVQRDQTRVYVGFCVPAIAKDPPLLVQFSGWYGVPHFTVQVEPWNAQYRLDEGDRKLARASDQLRSAGFQTNGWYWARVHEPDEYLGADDVPARLLEFIEQDVRLIVKSGALDHDLELGLTKARGGPPRHRRLPQAQ